MSDNLPAPVTEPRTRTLRTAVQTAVAFIVAFPFIWGAVQAGFAENATPVPAWLTAAGAVLLVASSVVTRVMAVPQVNNWLSEHVAWLASEAGQR